MNLLETLYLTDGIIFIFIMIIMAFVMQDRFSCDPAMLQVLPREGFCTCRGMQFNNSEGNPHQNDCYRNKIPAKVWADSHAGCTEFDDPGKISWDYNIEQKQLPQFAGV